MLPLLYPRVCLHPLLPGGINRQLVFLRPFGGLELIPEESVSGYALSRTSSSREVLLAAEMKGLKLIGPGILGTIIEDAPLLCCLDPIPTLVLGRVSTTALVVGTAPMTLDVPFLSEFYTGVSSQRT